MSENLKKEKWRLRREMGKKEENEPDSEYGEWTSSVNLPLRLNAEYKRIQANVS